LKYINQLKTPKPNPNNQKINEIIYKIEEINKENFEEKINIIFINYYRLRYSLQNKNNIDYTTNIVIKDKTLSESIYEIIENYFYNATEFDKMRNNANINDNTSLDITKKMIFKQMNAYFKQIHDNSKINDFEKTINNEQIKGKIFARIDYSNNSSDNSSDYLLLTQNGNDYPFIFVHYNEPTAISETKNNTTELAIATSVANNSTTTPPNVLSFIPTGGKTQKKFPKRKRSIVFSRRK
jgi:hypothetical protein